MMRCCSCVLIVLLCGISQVAARRHKMQGLQKLKVEANSSLTVVANSSLTGECPYVRPDALAEGSYDNMWKLMDPSWSVNEPQEGGQGVASGKTTLLYVYGPIFTGMATLTASCKPQILAVTYTQGMVLSYYSKPSCMGLSRNGCCNSGGNFPSSRTSCGGCPSCSYEGGFFGGKGCYADSSKQYKPGQEVDYGGFGKYYLAQVGDMFRLEKTKGSGCYVDHIYACDQSSFVVKYKKLDGNFCSP